MDKCFGVALLAWAFLGTTALAQPPARRHRQPAIPPYLEMERLSRMTPEQRNALLGALPGERRTLVEERLRKFSEMPEPARNRLRDEYNHFQRLPPEKQEEMRKLFRQLNDFPEQRRRAVRKELVRLRNMTPERRTARMKSEAFQEDFNETEREFLVNLTGLLTETASLPVPD